MFKHLTGGLFVTALVLWPQTGCQFLPERQSAQVVVPLPAQTSAAKAPVELPPDKAATACLATAEALERAGHDLQAIHQYERARREYGSKSPIISRRLAVLYDRQGEVSLAMAEYKQALEASPKDADLLNDFGYFHYNRGDWSEAEKHFRQALESNNRHGRAWINLGMTLGQMGRYEESHQAFSKVITPAEAHSNMGFILMTQGKREQAKNAYRQALSLQPDLRLAQVALARLENREISPPAAEPTPSRSSVSAQNKAEAMKRLQAFVQEHSARLGETVPATPTPTVPSQPPTSVPDLPSRETQQSSVLSPAASSARSVIAATPTNKPPAIPPQRGTPATVSFE